MEVKQGCKEYSAKKTVTVGFLVEDGKGVISVVEIQDGFVVLPKHSLLAPTNVLASAGPKREPMATLLICLHMVLWKLNSTDKEAVVSNWYRVTKLLLIFSTKSILPAIYKDAMPSLNKAMRHIKTCVTCDCWTESTEVCLQ